MLSAAGMWQELSARFRSSSQQPKAARIASGRNSGSAWRARWPTSWRAQRSRRRSLASTARLTGCRRSLTSSRVPLTCVPRPPSWLHCSHEVSVSTIEDVIHLRGLSRCAEFAPMQQPAMESCFFSQDNSDAPLQVIHMGRNHMATCGKLSCYGPQRQADSNHCV